jgi:hypothetical protein
MTGRSRLAAPPITFTTLRRIADREASSVMWSNGSPFQRRYKDRAIAGWRPKRDLDGLHAPYRTKP